MEYHYSGPPIRVTDPSIIYLQFNDSYISVKEIIDELDRTQRIAGCLQGRVSHLEEEICRIKDHLSIADN
jgi:hypothetical protein